jgi:hypothetical protein
VWQHLTWRQGPVKKARISVKSSSRTLHQPVRAAYIPEKTDAPARFFGRRPRQEIARSGMDAVAIVLALAVFALMFGLIRAMDRI